jgi:hypothetical protein
MRIPITFLIFLSAISFTKADNHDESLSNSSNATDLEEVWADWSGEWARYQWDNIVTKTISAGHETFRRRTQYGAVTGGFSNQMEISLENGIYWYTKLHNRTGKAQYKGAFKLHRDHFYEYNRGILHDTDNKPEIWQWFRTSNPIFKLHEASRQGDLESVKGILAGEKVGVDSTLDDSYTALAYAAAGGHLSLVKELLAHGADVNLQTRFSKSPLNHAVGGGSEEACELLIGAGARLDLRNDNGSSLLHEAAYWGQADMIPFLVSKGQKVNDSGQRYGATPLIYAINRANSASSIEAAGKFINFAMTLLEHGADADLTNNAGKSARSIAAESKFDSVRDLF